MNTFNIIGIILVAIFVAIIAYFAIKSMADDIRTQEGCAGCNGVCTRNGGYCPRKKDHRPKPSKKILWELSSSDGQADRLSGKIIAVCCNKYQKVTSLRNMHYMILYRVGRNGINSRKLFSIGDISREKQLREIKKEHVNLILAARVSQEEQEKLSKEGLILMTVYDPMPDQAIDSFFKSDLKRADLRQTRLVSMIIGRMKESYQRYPDMPGATLLHRIGTTFVYLSVVGVIICGFSLAFGLHPALFRGLLAIVVLIQAAAAGMVIKSEDMVKKQNRRRSG